MNKKLILILSAFLFLRGESVLASVPLKLAYQIMVVDPQTGFIRTNDNVTLRLEVRKGSQTGTTVFGQDFNITTDKSGLCSVTLDIPESVDWSDGDYYMATLVDGELSSASSITSVPYAIMSKSVEPAVSASDLIGTWRYQYTDTKYSEDYDYVYNFNENGTGSYSFYKLYSSSSYVDKTEYTFTWHFLANGSLAIDVIDTGVGEFSYPRRRVCYPEIISTKQMWIVNLREYDFDAQSLFTKQ